jgi:hypothetical protein
MKGYEVTWTINILAETAEDAAREALKIQRDSESTALCFIVSAEARPANSIVVDLWEEE